MAAKSIIITRKKGTNKVEAFTALNTACEYTGQSVKYLRKKTAGNFPIGTDLEHLGWVYSKREIQRAVRNTKEVT